MRTRLTLTLLLVAAGCTEPQPVDPPRLLEPEPIELGFEASTTDGVVALGNLTAQIEGLRAVLRAGGEDSQRAALSALLLQRSQVLGAIEDVEEAGEVAQAIVDDDTRAITEASVRSARHDWTSALALLPEGDPRSESIRESIAIARGESLAEVIAARTERAAEHSTFRTETELAIALTEAGRWDEADAAYRRALAQYRDVSPLPVAFVQFQRGVMWSERAGRPGRAVALYREAVRRLPGYVVAVVHLAELEVELGQRDLALARLRAIADTSADPEPAGLLAELLVGDDPSESARMLELARRRYDVLLERHLLAYADHGTEFFLGPGGDPARALSLATHNLENRRTERAYDLAIRAAHAAGDPAAMCRWIVEAPSPATIAPLRETLAIHAPSCP